MTNRDESTKKGGQLGRPTAHHLEATKRRPLNATKHALFITIFRIFVKGNKHYITPSRTKVLELLAKRYNIDIKVRWLSECVRALIERGYIKRKRRWKHLDFNAIQSIPSMIALTPSGVSYLNMLGFPGASDLWKRTLTWLKKGDGRFPTTPLDAFSPDKAACEAGRAREPRPSNTIYIDRRTERSDALVRLKEIIEKIV